MIVKVYRKRTTMMNPMYEYSFSPIAGGEEWETTKQPVACAYAVPIDSIFAKVFSRPDIVLISGNNIWSASEVASLYPNWGRILEYPDQEKQRAADEYAEVRQAEDAVGYADDNN